MNINPVSHTCTRVIRFGSRNHFVARIDGDDTPAVAHAPQQVNHRIANRHPAFKGATPYAPVVVETEEGVRIVSELVDCAPDAVAIDMPVEVVFDAVTPEVTLPKFRRA